MTLFCIFFGIISPKLANSQSIECGTDLPPGAIQVLIDQQPAIQAFKEAQATQSQSIQDVPVRFTAFQGPSGGFGLSQAQIDFGLNQLNLAFAPVGLNFIQCGEVNNINDDRIANSNDYDQLISSFSYTSGAIEVYIKGGLGQNFAAIPLAAYLSANPNYNFPGFEHSNIIRLTSPSSMTTTTFVHETGRHFGLLHTHHVVAEYNVPLLGDDTQDYPYPVLDQNNQIDSAWWGRELVTRTGYLQSDPQVFKQINFKSAGDLIEDTPADCATDIAQIWPGCPLNAQDINTCTFNSTLTYADYNGDPIFPPASGYSLGRNYMSYWNHACRNQFTPGQITNIAYYYTTERQPFYTTNRCGTFTDNVELEGTSTPLHNATLRVRHPNNSQICNVTSSKTGDFSGILHTDNLMVNAYHNGLKNSLKYPADPLKMHYGHTRCEWIKGVNVADLALISKHILGIAPLASGYRLIAADANRSNSVTTEDQVDLRKLILGIYLDYLPNQDQPWRFIPEFVPQNDPVTFNIFPFNVPIGGGAAYLEQGWGYTTPAIGQRGFDGIKIGDVNFSWKTDTTKCMAEQVANEFSGELPSFEVPNVGLPQGEIVKLVVKSQNFSQVSGFQLGIKFPYDYFELMDVTNLSLPFYTKEDHFGLMQLEENAVRTLWLNETGGTTTLPDNTILFSLVVKTKQPITNLQEVLKLDNSVLPNIFLKNYVQPAGLVVSVDPALAYHSDVITLPKNGSNTIFCDPNPFTSTLNIGIEHKGLETLALLQVFNLLGLPVFEQNIYLNSGTNTLSISGLKNLPAGLYNLIIQIEDERHSIKVVKK